MLQIGQTINLNDRPPLRNGGVYSITKHLELGEIVITEGLVTLVQSDRQKDRGKSKRKSFVRINDLLAEVGGRKFGNATLMNLYLENPNLIPAEWHVAKALRTRGKRIIFPGTEYTLPGIGTFVCYIYSSNSKWVCGGLFLKSAMLGSSDFVAVLPES